MARPVYPLLVIAILAGAVSKHDAQAAHLTLEGYLQQVREKNQNVRSAVAMAQGAELRAEEAQLLLAPTAFINTQFTSDAKLTAPVFVGYDNQIIKYFSVGVKKTTTFGLEAKLRYDISTLNYTNPVLFFSIPGASTSIPLTISNASPVLEVTQSLWSNGFGRSTRAYQDAHEAQALASSHTAKFQAKSALAQAESDYWRLALTRQTVAVLEGALDRANKIYEWNLKRSQLHLGDQSDVLQSEALKQSRELELTGAKTDELTASRAFNSSRNIDSEKVSEVLTPLDPEMIEHLEVPQRAEMREDVKAAQQNVRAATANAEVAIERDQPTLDLYASLSLNGQSGYTIFGNLSDAIANSFTFNRPTQVIGLRFSAPISLGLARRSRDGWRQEQVSADLQLQRKIFDQEQAWNTLNETFLATKKHFDLSRKLEKIQEAKLASERARLHKGRSTTYQVLLFEQDYLLAQLIRIRDQANLLSIVAQMKTFGEAL